MGISTINGTGLGVVRIPAGNSVVSGDLVMNTESGLATTVSPKLPLASNISTVSGPNAISTLSVSIYGNTSSGDNLRSEVDELGDGNIVRVWSGNESGSSDVDWVNIQIMTPLFGNAVPKISITDTGVSGRIRVKKLTSTSFVVVWASSSTLKFAIYSNTGSVIKSATTIIGTTQASRNYWNLASNGAGNFVVSYAASTSACYFSIFDSTGTIVGSQTSITTNDTIGHQLMYHSNGSFVVFYRDTTASTSKLARYTSTGGLIGTSTLVYGAGNSTNGDRTTMTELSDGNVATVVLNNSTGWWNYVHSPTGTLVNSVNFLTIAQGASVSYPASSVTSLVGGGFVLVNKLLSGGNNYFFRFDSIGNTIVSKSNCVFGDTSDTAASAVSIYDLGNSGVGFIVASESNGNGVYYMHVGRLDLAGNTIGTQYAVGTIARRTVGHLLSNGDMFAVTSSSTTNVSFSLHSLVRKSVLGVAQNTASKGATVVVSTQGTYNINQQISSGSSFDGRTAATSGTRGSVIGNTATLFGMN